MLAGRKIKGPKPEKTTDYIHVPDLTGLDSGALSMDDIAENYAAVGFIWYSTKLSCRIHGSGFLM